MKFAVLMVLGLFLLSAVVDAQIDLPFEEGEITLPSLTPTTVTEQKTIDPQTGEEVIVFVAESCNDRIQNQNELGVDCGGSCKACSSGKLLIYIFISLGILVILIVVFVLIRKGTSKIGATQYAAGGQK